MNKISIVSKISSLDTGILVNFPYKNSLSTSLQILHENFLQNGCKSFFSAEKSPLKFLALKTVPFDLRPGTAYHLSTVCLYGKCWQIAVCV